MPNSSRVKRVVLVEDEPFVSSMLSKWLRDTYGWETLAILNTAEEGLARCEALRPDVAVIDLELPGMDGLTLAEKLAETSPATRIVIFTSHVDPFCVYRARHLAGCSYVSKGSGVEELSVAFDAINRGEVFHDTRLQIPLERLREPGAYFKMLSDRELEVVRYVCLGVTDDEIAERMGISRHTVITHRRNIRKKIDAHDDRAIVSYGKSWGIDALGLGDEDGKTEKPT